MLVVQLEADATLGDGCGLWDQLHILGDEMSPGLFQDFMDGYVEY